MAKKKYTRFSLTSDMANIANDIQHQIDDQIRMREGAMKLMSACSTLNQALETSKNLLTINARILGLMSALQKKKEQHVLKEYNRQRSSVYMDSSEDCCPGRIAMSDIRVPLMWKDNVHFSGKTGDQSYYAFALIRCGDQVRDTSLYEITSADTDMYFAETLIFEDLLPDLKMEFEVYYTVITSSEAHPIYKAPRASITIRSSSRRQAHFNAPKFCLAGHVQLCVDDISSGMISRDLIMGGKGASGVAVLGDIKEFPIHPLELWGQFCCELAAQPKCMMQKTIEGCCQVKMGDSWRKYHIELFQCRINGWKDKMNVEKTSPEFSVNLDENMKISADDTGGGSCRLNIISNDDSLHTLQFLNETDFMNWKFALRKEIHNARQWKVACLELMHIEECKKSRLSIPSTASFYDQIDIGDEPFTYPKAPTNGSLSTSSLSNIKENPEITVIDEVFDKSTSDEDIHNSGYVTNDVISPIHTHTKESDAKSKDAIIEEDEEGKLTTFPDVVLQVMDEGISTKEDVSSSSTPTTFEKGKSEMNKENVAPDEQTQNLSQGEGQTLVKSENDVSISEEQNNTSLSTSSEMMVESEINTNSSETSDKGSVVDTEVMDMEVMDTKVMDTSIDSKLELSETISVQETEKVEEIVTDLDSQNDLENTSTEETEVGCQLDSLSDVEMKPKDADSPSIPDDDSIAVDNTASVEELVVNENERENDTGERTESGTDLDRMISLVETNDTSGSIECHDELSKDDDAIQTNEDNSSLLDPSNEQVETPIVNDVETEPTESVPSSTESENVIQEPTESVTSPTEDENVIQKNDASETVASFHTNEVNHEIETSNIDKDEPHPKNDIMSSTENETELPVSDETNSSNDIDKNSAIENGEIQENENITNPVEHSEKDSSSVVKEVNIPVTFNADVSNLDNEQGVLDNSLIDSKTDNSNSINSSINIDQEEKSVAHCEETITEEANDSIPSDERTNNDSNISEVES